MNGRDHIITGIATLGSISILDACLVKNFSSGGSELDSSFATILNSANSWLLAGNEVISLYTFFVFALYVLGTILPDIDSKSSMIGRWIHIPVEHRTWFHALYIPILLFIASIWIRPLFFLGFGYLVHLFFDSFSTCGICWFYPYPGYVGFDGGARVKKHHMIKLYRSDSTAEYVIVGLVCAIFIGCICLGLSNDILH